MKPSKELILIVLVLALLIAVSFFRQRSVPTRSPQAEDVKYISYSAEKHGTKALYLLLKKLGYRPKRLRMPHLTEMRAKGLAIILAPDRPPINKTDAEALLDWLRRGNTMLFAPSDGEDRLAKSLGIELSRGQPAEASIAPFAFTNLTAGVQRLSVRSGDRILTERMNAVKHFSDSAGGVIISLREGEGTAIVLSDPYFITNAGLSEGDNLKLLVNVLLACVDDTKTVYFDEYHHGFGERPTVLHLLKGTSLGWALLQVAGAVALLMYSRGRRFGKPKPVLSEEHRSSVEYVTSLADIYRSAQASNVALSNLCDRMDNGSVSELRDECRRKIAKGKIDEKELLDLSKRMELARHTGEGK